ncbi:MAG TPA: nucleotidyltransferase family protein [Vicinamibacterales bacterium]|nr:nucleotidyltransferase family protein [Vicinamibacterales bacterium]
MLPGVILAAGDSTRMGSPKALLLTRDGRPFVAAIAETFAAAGITEIVVVTGRDHERITAALAHERLPAPPEVVRNLDPSRGQLSSLLLGIDSLPAAAPAAVVTLVDVPLMTAETVRLVISEWQRTGAPIVRPAIGERHGHPVVFDRRLFQELRQAPLDVGAKAVVRAHSAEIVNVPVTDTGCLVDVDTPADYEALR